MHLLDKMDMHTSISHREPESDYNLYAKQLASLGYGIPLWQPAPLSDYKRVKIADVGYIRTGQFYRLFNASLPSDNPAQCRGVPANFQPLHLDEVSSEQKQLRMPGVLHSAGLRLEGVDFNLAANPSWVENRQTVRFESSSGQGAILVTKDATLREDALQLGFLESYMAENYESWLEMANSVLGRGVRLEDLILVTGYDLTTQSTMVTFDGGGTDFAITFKAAYPSVGSSSFSTWGEWHTVSSATVFKNFGSPDLLPEFPLSPNQQPVPEASTTDRSDFSQCVFLRGFRIRRRPSTASSTREFPENLGQDDLEGNAVSVCQSDHIDTVGPIDGTKCDETITIECVADKHPFVDPLASHFQHIFETTEVQQAIAHDNEISTQIVSNTAQDDNNPPPPSPTVTMMDNEALRPSTPEAERSRDLTPSSPPGILAPQESPSTPPANLNPSSPPEIPDPQPSPSINPANLILSSPTGTPALQPSPDTNPANLNPSSPAGTPAPPPSPSIDLANLEPSSPPGSPPPQPSPSIEPANLNPSSPPGSSRPQPSPSMNPGDLNPSSQPGSPALPPSPSTDPADWVFPPTPAGLKGVTAYLQRAQELKVKNPVIAYWCTYYAAKRGIMSTVQNGDTQMFLVQVLTVLEGMKISLGDNDAVLDDAVSVKYIASFASRVFKKADSEDQKQKANRSTAKKFLASATFFELLRLFRQPIGEDIEDKIDYAKWKAADIAKACSERRTPLSGNMHAPSYFSWAGSVATPTASEALDLPHEAMSAWSPGPSIGPSLAPSPAVQGFKSLESSPAARVDVLPHTVADISSAIYRVFPPSCLETLPALDTLDAQHSSGETTMAEGEPERVAGFSWKLSEGQGCGESAVQESQEDLDGWLKLAFQPASGQGTGMFVDDASFVPDDAPVAPEDTFPGIMLDTQPEESPPMMRVKRVHFSPSVVGGLSSTSSSVAASSPPASPERYAPSLPTVPEAAYLSDSDHEGRQSHNTAPPRQDPTLVPLPESIASASSASDSEDSEGWARGMPPVITRVPSPTSPPSPSSAFSSAKILPSAASPQLASPSPQFGTRFLAGFSPHPRAPPALHPTPRFFPRALAPYSSDIAPSPPSASDGSAWLNFEGTQLAQAQRHCRFAISALDYEDAEAARNEIRAALAKLYD